MKHSYHMTHSYRLRACGRRRSLIGLALSVAAVLAAACGGQPGDSGADSAAAPVPVTGSSATDQPFAFTDADLDALQRGLSREIELVRAAKAWQDTAKTPEERGRAAQAQFETFTAPEAAKAIGVPVDRYQRTRETVRQVLTTLDFQGKIDGPMELDTTRASAEAKERLRSDPFAELAPGSAAALRARLDQLAPVWIEYVRLTATAG